MNGSPPTIIILTPPLAADAYKIADRRSELIHPPIVMAEFQPVFDHGKYLGVQDTFDDIRQRTRNIIKDKLDD